MKVMKKFFFGVVPFIILQACDPIDKRLTLRNESEDLIFYAMSPNDSIRGRSPLISSYRIEQADTLWDESSNLLLSDSGKSVAMIGRNAWENYINERCKDSTLRIFVFEKNLITQVPWDTLVIKQLYSKKFTYKVKDLEKLNWRVEYKKQKAR